MPLYEYHCKACDHRYERIQKFSDPLETICPGCGKEAVEQVITAPAVQFKGSGWYVTDYAKKNSSTGSSAPATSQMESAVESKPEITPAAETKSEAKPAASSESKPASKAAGA